MKILSLHTDYIKFKPLKKAIKGIEELSDIEKEERTVENALTIMTAVEKHDTNVTEVVEKLVKEILDIAKQVNASNIVLYPYAHLSSNLAAPNIAQEVLIGTEKALNLIKGLNITRAPFGYYKEFEMKVKGHPLSELSREINQEAVGKIIKGTDETYDAKFLLNEISKSKLDRTKLKENDHRILGMQMDLYSFSETAPGMVFWHNNGLIIRNELINFWRELHKNRNYQEIKTPQILDKRLWQISGHWEKYKENIFLTKYEDREFAVKPMNCPGGMLVYKNSPKSYKEFPLRVAELGEVHRQELSGVLGGLFRVIQFTQDDAHIFCTEKQIEEEIFGIMDLIDLVYKKFGFNYRVELSTRPEKRIGDEKLWDMAEAALQKVLEKRKIKFKINKGDGAFYGPKIDFHLTDSLGREWQCGTIQLDMAMPERFELEYTDSDNTRKRPVMLHRTVYGSLERFIGILIEHFNGRLPTWLAPIQVRILSFTDRNIDFSKKVLAEIKKSIPNSRIDSDFNQTTIQSKVKSAEEMKVPYIITLGDKEEKSNNLAIRTRGKKELEQMSLKDFISKLKEEIESRH